MKSKILVLAAGFILASCASKKTEKLNVISLDEVEKEIVVNLEVGELVKVSAKTNPSTGYTWEMKSENGCSAKFIDETTESIYNDGRVGGPMNVIYEFKGDKVGTCTVSFDYIRSWEGPSQNPKQIKFIVK